MTVARSKQGARAAQSPFPADIRFFDGNKWLKVDPDQLPPLSAIAWAFARELAAARNVPVGMIVAARGGVRIEAWMPRAAVDMTERGRKLAALSDSPEVIAAAAADAKQSRPYAQTKLHQWMMGRALPMSLYERLIRPLGDLSLRGVLWYQGESNAETAEDAFNYRGQLRDLVQAWRGQWRRPDLPFLVVGLPAYNPKPGEGTLESWKTLRESQRAAVASLADTFLVDIFDLGDPARIHPLRKYEVGQRLEERALTSIYGGAGR
jgi:sialate O-acetylesterase